MRVMSKVFKNKNVSTFKMTVFAMINTRVIAQTGSNGNLEKRFKQKVNRMKGFQKKISDDRKKNVIDIAKDIDELVKSEISQTRSLIDDHIDFLKREWEEDKEECYDPLVACDEVNEESTEILDEEDYFE